MEREFLQSALATGASDITNQLTAMEFVADITPFLSKAKITIWRLSPQMSQKVTPPKTFCGIFSPGEPVSLKITLVIAQTYSCVYTNFGQFI